MSNESLGAKQQRFTYMISQLIQFAYEQDGYSLTFGEAYRTAEQAEINAKKGIGIKNSVHCDRLAVDFNLFINSIYQTATSSYKLLGEYWESLGGNWGGHFNDGNHFSLEHNGRK